jgi:predicted Co/Zn/Cd cation transporter (cation efflux family)
VIFALLYAACVVGCAFALAFAPQLADELEEELLPVQMQFGIMLVVSVPLFILFAVAPLLPKKKWAWIYGFVPICIGLTSCCSLPFSIPLLIFWLKPETKAFFGTD